MLIVQKFHSIHEIDPEFIPSLEVLLQEDIANFETLVQRHDSAPDSDVFTYFLFFGPTQNTPIGFAQLCLKSIPHKKFVPWYKKLTFWNKEYKHWKEVSWQIGDGSSGMCIFDPKYSRSGKEKIQSLIKEYESRPDIKAQEFHTVKGLQDFNMEMDPVNEWSKESYILEPLTKAHKTYQGYVEGLPLEMQNVIKDCWKILVKNKHISIHHYPTIHTPIPLTLPKEQLEYLEKWGTEVLTFEMDNKMLGCLLILKGKNGNVFFEPFPFEAEGEAIIPDELYTQYALLKFFELNDARKCHLMKFGSKLVFDDREDLKFFNSQGFQVKTIVRQFRSKLKSLDRPL